MILRQSKGVHRRLLLIAVLRQGPQSCGQADVYAGGRRRIQFWDCDDSCRKRSKFWERMRKMNDLRQYAPATLRNRDFILTVLRDVLPTTGVILEIASGSGEHVVHFARNFPDLVFKPSDREPDALQSVAAWVSVFRRRRLPLFGLQF